MEDSYKYKYKIIMFPVVGLVEETRRAGKEEENDRNQIILKCITLCRNKTQQNALKTVEQYRIGGNYKEE
jgi:hypothetical protein